jgi:hypothetical protein
MCPRQGSNFLSLPRKKVTKERGTRRWRSACGRLLCGARSLGPAPNSLRGLRPLRSDKRREVRLRSVLRTRPQSPALLDATHGAQEQCGCCSATSPHLASHRRERSDAQSSRCEASRIWCSGPRGWRRGAQGFGAARVSAHQQLTSRRLSERRERSEQSELGARPQIPSTAEQSGAAGPPPSGRLSFAYFSLAKQRKVGRLSGRHPDAASRSEKKPHANAGTRRHAT